MAVDSASIDLEKDSTEVNDDGVLYYMEILIDMQEYCVDGDDRE